MALDYREQHRREAIIGTVVIHALLVALFVFTVFKGPDPPLTEMGGGGVELNYGVDEAGYGDIQTLAQANNSRNTEDSRPPARNPDPQPAPQPARAAAPTPPEAAEEKIITSDAEESPVKIPPVERPTPPKPVVRETPPVEKPEPVKEVVREAPPAPKPRTLYSPKGNDEGGGNGSAGTSNTPTGNNNGDRPGATGDQGNPQGSLDARALYGTPGSGGGDGGGSGGGSGSGDGFGNGGWTFSSKPQPPLVDNQGGYLRFKITIDPEGEIISVTKVGGTMSANQVAACLKTIRERFTFRKTRPDSGGGVGYITFRFRLE